MPYTGKGTLLNQFPYFEPESDLTLRWSRGGSSPVITKRLDSRFQWSGSNADTVGWFGRYGEGNGAPTSDELAGHHITTYGSHGGTDSGEAFAILQAAIEEEFGLRVIPPSQAVVDFGANNSEDGRPIGVEYWLKLLGRESPISQEPRPKPQPKPKPPVVAPAPPPTPPTPPIHPPVPVEPQPKPNPPATSRVMQIDFTCTPAKTSHSFDLPPNTTRLDGDLVMVIPEDPRQVLLAPRGPLANVSNVRVAFFALRGNNTGKSEKKAKRVLRWGFTQGAGDQARVEGDITAKDGQVSGPALLLPGVHRIRFTHLTATGVTTFTFSNGRSMQTISNEKGPLMSAKFWLGTNLPPDVSKTSYIPPIGRISGSLTINGAAGGTQPVPIPIPVPPIQGDLVGMVKELRAKARDLDNVAEALLNLVEERL